MEKEKSKSYLVLFLTVILLAFVLFGSWGLAGEPDQFLGIRGGFCFFLWFIIYFVMGALGMMLFVGPIFEAIDETSPRFSWGCSLIFLFLGIVFLFYKGC